MSKQNTSAPRLSMRGGAIVMKSISRFLAGARNKPKTTKGSTTKTKTKKMSEKDNMCKCSPKILEAAKRDTLFTRYFFETLNDNVATMRVSF